MSLSKSQEAKLKEVGEFVVSVGASYLIRFYMSVEIQVPCSSSPKVLDVACLYII